MKMFYIIMSSKIPIAIVSKYLHFNSIRCSI